MESKEYPIGTAVVVTTSYRHNFHKMYGYDPDKVYHIKDQKENDKGLYLYKIEVDNDYWHNEWFELKEDVGISSPTKKPKQSTKCTCFKVTKEEQKLILAIRASKSGFEESTTIIRKFKLLE